MFRIGQKVKYIGPGIDGRHLDQVVPVPHEIYTVRANGEVHGVAAIHLFEIVNAPRDWGNGVYELWMNRDWFRPLVERKTDISIFTAMLNRKTEKA